jgi:predicted RNase H-like nuclease (RuvC/YqgF family)
MDDLIKFQNEQIQALQKRNEYLENELKQAKQILQSLINEWEVNDAEVVEPNLLDNDFQSPIEQLDKIFKNMY